MINWGIVGAGDWVRDYHLPVLRKLAERKVIKLTAIWNRSPDKAALLAKKHGIPHVCKTFDELLCAHSVDALTISLDKSVSGKYIKSASEKGIPFVAEKPAAKSWKEALELKRIIGNLPHVIGFNRRFAPVTQEAINYLPEKIEHYTMEMWRKDRKDKRFVYETGIHAINLTEYMFGPIVRAEILDKTMVDRHLRELRLKTVHRRCEGEIDFQTHGKESCERLKVCAPALDLDVRFGQPYSADQLSTLMIHDKAQKRTLTPYTGSQNKHDEFGFTAEYDNFLSRYFSEKSSASSMDTILNTLRIAEWAESAGERESVSLISEEPLY